MKLEKRIAISVVLYTLGFIITAINLTAVHVPWFLLLFGPALEIGALVAWWALGQDEFEWVSMDRWRLLANTAIVGGVGILMLSFALTALGPWGIGASEVLIGLLVPFLAAGLIAGGVKVHYDLRGRSDSPLEGF